MKKLVILESPKKIGKVKQYLSECDKDNTYIVKASIGHFRELSDIGEYNMGINLDTMVGEFSISFEKANIVKELIIEAEKVDEIILATDPDREGEVIAWHLLEVLKPYCKNFKRMMLNSITLSEVSKELNLLKDINYSYVNSGLTRQLLDRMVGFRLSGIVKNNTGGASAGRVQSAVLGILSEREIEIIGHNKKDYWLIQDSILNISNHILKDSWVLNKIYEKDLAITNLKSLGNKYIVDKIEEKNFKDKPYINFTTSDYLQSANSQLKIKVKQATNIAQDLFSWGLISYIRTDSTKLDIENKNKLIKFATDKYGEEKIGTIHERTGKETDQEGHPPIIPTHFEWEPNDIRKYTDEELSVDHLKVYELIWNNTILSTLKQPDGLKKTYYLKNNDFYFIKEIKIYDNLGYLTFLNKTPSNEVFDHQIGDIIDVGKLDLKADFDKPKPRFNQATLIKELENKGIGRPSTYKTSVEVNLTRGYAELDKKESIVVKEIGLKVYDFLKNNFDYLIDTKFTNLMENKLDLISKDKLEFKKYLKDFYFELDSKCTILNEKLEKCKKCEIGFLVKRISTKTNKSFIACNNYPDCDFIAFDEQSFENNKNCEKCNVGKLIINKKKNGDEYEYCNNKNNCDFVNWDYGVKFYKCQKCNDQKVKKNLVAKNGTKYDKCFAPNCNYIDFKNK